MTDDGKKEAMIEENEDLEDEEELENEENVASEETSNESVNENLENEVSEDTEEASVDDDKLPFPRATITNLVRKNVSKGKQIKGTVKDEMNIWVAEMIKRITGKMNSQPYTFVNYDMLKESIAPYEQIADIETQRDKLLKKINAISKECDSVISYIDEEAKAKAQSIKLLEEELAFPKATITNKIRSNLDEGKTIKGPVKKGLNIWLGRVVQRVSKRMDTYPYPYIDRSMFKEAIEPYETIGEIELEKEMIIQQMQSMKTICKMLDMEVQRKFKL